MYFDSLNTKEFTDSRNFRRTVVPLFTKKASKDGQIILNEAEKCISDDKKICKLFNNFFSKLSQTKKYLTTVIIFHKKTYILSQLALKRLKNTPVYLILKKDIWFSFFIQKDYSRGGIESYPGFRNTKKAVRRVALPLKLSYWVPIFSQIWFTTTLTTALIKMNFWTIWNRLI